MCWKCPLCHQPGDWWKYWTISTPVSFPGVLCSLLAARWPITTLITILWPNGPANFLVQLIFNPSNNLFIQFMFAQLLHENAAGEFPAVKAVSDRCEFLIMNSSHQHPQVNPACSPESQHLQLLKADLHLFLLLLVVSFPFFSNHVGYVRCGSKPCQRNVSKEKH